MPSYEDTISPRPHSIIEYLKQNNCSKVKIGLTDIDGIVRGKMVNLSKFESSLKNPLGFCDVVFGWDINDQCYFPNSKEGSQFTGEHTGFPDARLSIDPNTLRHIPWDQDCPFFLADFIDENNKPSAICPRSLLKKVQAQAKGLGFDVYFAQEYEWFNFQRDEQKWQEHLKFKASEGLSTHLPISNAMSGYSLLRTFQNSAFFQALFDQMNRFKIPLEGLHTETGPGVYEAAIQYTDVLEAADRSALFKLAVKSIAYQHGILPSFMAKWNEKLPGCSGHLHQSLFRNGKNIFFDPGRPHQISAEMESYLAGLIYGIPHLLPLFAPTINSYKRFVEGSWAPTQVNWGVDNRTVCLRVIPGGASSTRIENRLPGSDVNPYLAMAASLSLGLYGIQKNLKLNSKDSRLRPEPLANNLYEATQKMERSELANELLGENFIKHFSTSRYWECQLYAKSVSSWEHHRYFELI